MACSLLTEGKELGARVIKGEETLPKGEKRGELNFKSQPRRQEALWVYVAQRQDRKGDLDFTSQASIPLGMPPRQSRAQPAPQRFHLARQESCPGMALGMGSHCEGILLLSLQKLPLEIGVTGEASRNREWKPNVLRGLLVSPKFLSKIFLGPTSLCDRDADDCLNINSLCFKKKKECSTRLDLSS